MSRVRPMSWFAAMGLVAVVMAPKEASAQANCWNCNQAKTACRDFQSSGWSGCEVTNGHCNASGNQCGIAGGGGGEIPPVIAGPPEGSEDPYLVYGAVFVGTAARALPRMPEDPLVVEASVAKGARELEELLHNSGNASSSHLGLAATFMAVGVGSDSREYRDASGNGFAWTIAREGSGRSVLLRRLGDGNQAELRVFRLSCG